MFPYLWFAKITFGVDDIPSSLTLVNKDSIESRDPDENLHEVLSYIEKVLINPTEHLMYKAFLSVAFRESCLFLQYYFSWYHDVNCSSLLLL